MPVGAGRYDEICTVVRAATGGELVIVIVIDGDQGDSFQLQASPEYAAAARTIVPRVLRSVADEIEKG